MNNKIERILVVNKREKKKSKDKRERDKIIKYT